MKTVSMPANDPHIVRPRSFAIMPKQTSPTTDGITHWRMRGQNFFAEYVICPGAPQSFECVSEQEMLLILPDCAAILRRAGRSTRQVAGHSVCILPAGRWSIQLATAGHCAVLATSRPDQTATAWSNHSDYAVSDARIRPITGYRRATPLEDVEVFIIDEIQAPPDNPRLKMFQSETLSINWVEYDGVRDRSALSPHSHTDFEQGSLALAGDYLHHLRVNWGRNADLWRNDEHLAAPSPSLLVVPVHMIHTTEGTGDGRHLLIDIFTPPRADFIARNWVYNAADYLAI